MQHFQSRPPLDVLQDIYLLKKRKDKGEHIDLPLITITFHNKQAVSGFLMDMKLETNGARHLSMELDGSRDVALIEAYYIQSVIIHNVADIAHLITEVDAQSTKERKPVTRLEIKSKLTEDSNILKSVFGKPIEIKYEETPRDTSDYYFIKQLITDIGMCLRSIGEDETGKTAIAESIDYILLQNATTLQLKLQDKTLVVADTLTRSYSTNLQRANLQTAIIEVL